jgi:hypothetical protein
MYKLLCDFSQQFLMTQTKPSPRNASFVQDKLSALGINIDYSFAEQLACLHSGDSGQFYVLLPALALNIFNVEDTQGKADCLQNMLDHAWLVSHINKRNVDVTALRIRTKNWSKEMLGLAKSWIQDGINFRDHVTKTGDLKYADCCWSPFHVFNGNASRKHSCEWHDYLFKSLVDRPISKDGLTHKDVIDDMEYRDACFHTRTGISISKLRSIDGDVMNFTTTFNSMLPTVQQLNRMKRPSQLQGGGVPPGPTSVWQQGSAAYPKGQVLGVMSVSRGGKSIVAQVVDDIMKQAQAAGVLQAQPSIVIDSLGSSCPVVDDKIKKGETRFLSLEMPYDEVYKRILANTQAPPEDLPCYLTETRDPNQFKHTPSVPGHNKNKPWLSGKRKRKL